MERSRQAFDEISEAPWDDLRGYSVVHPTEEQATTPPPNYCDDTSAQAPSGVSNDFNELEPVNGSPCGAHAQPSLGAGSRAEAGLQADDVDWFTLVAGGGTYQIATECHGDTLVSVYTNQGELVGRDDNGGDAQCSSLIVGLEAGRHLLRVELAQSTAPGSYTLTVDLL